MLAEIFRFELRLQLRSALPWVAGLVFALFAFGATSTDAVQIGGPLGNVHRNAPSVIIGFFSTFSVLGMFPITVFIAGPLLRDFELGTDELFFATPLRRSAYVGGRIAAGALASLTIFLLTGAGMLLGSSMPWIDPARLGAFSLAPYLWAFAVIVLPNLCFCAGVLGLLAVTTRRLLTVYLGVAGMFALFLASGIMLREIRYDAYAALLDPFGGRALSIVTRYWSANEKNSQLPELSRYLLWNRALWLGASGILLSLTFALFRPERMRVRRLKKRVLAAPPEPRSAQPLALPPTAAPATASVRAAQLWHQLSFDAAGVLKGVPFLVLLAFGLLNLIARSFSFDNFYGTAILPVTRVMLQMLEGSYAFLLVLIVGFYAGELVFRERSANVAAVSDSMPVPSWIFVLAKVGALIGVVLAFVGVGELVCIAIQLARGYTRIEPGLYVAGGLMLAWPFVMFAVAALFLQVLSDQRFVGYLLFVVLMVLQIALPPLHFEHNLYNFASMPSAPYSDMNGYGQFLPGFLWYGAYWSVFCVLLVVLASALWVRGLRPRWALHVRHAARSMSLPLVATLWLALAAVGGWCFYNTNVVNAYLPGDVKLDRRAHYEKQYRGLKDVPQPRLHDVRTDVDIYPEARRMVVRGHHGYLNEQPQPIQDLHMFVDTSVQLKRVDIASATLVRSDDEVGYRHYRLAQPLQPGARLVLDYELERIDRGFTNSGWPNQESALMPSPLNENGTFFDSVSLFPHFGYEQERQIIDRNERRRRGLGDVPRARKLEDTAGYAVTGVAADADRIQLETTVSTSADQIALAPGYLERSWVDGNRRYFHYVMDRPILALFCYLSGRWEVKRAQWNNVAIEVYFDPQHPYNVQRMIDTAQRSLDYFTTNFSPYPDRQLRILEFPGYATFAESFANTIPFSESIGFIADLREPDRVDYVSYVTAHEVAHQWWGHQVIGAHVQGQSMLIESLAQYSALMVMEKLHGREHMRRFLKYELDGYLRARGGELIEELPLMRVEDQMYIHYQKGSLVFYRLRDEIGEEALNRALHKFVRDKAFQHAPFTTSRELLDYLRAETPASKHTLLDELFAHIVFYDNRVVAAHSERLPDGKWSTEIEWTSAKTEADGVGKETPLALDDFMEVGVFERASGAPEASERVLYLQKQHVTTGQGKLRVVVDSKPDEVGIDPYNKLIDRNSDDNRKRVED